MTTISIRSKYFYGLAALITLGGLALRLTSLGGSLEYDEIWTLEFYAGKSIGAIFSDLSLPNNHPLNSLLVKLTAAGDNSVSIRLGAWLAGILAIPAAGYLAWLLCRKRRAALWTMAVIALSAPLAAYAQLARGYSLQFLLLLVFGIGASWLWRDRHAVAAGVLIAVGAIGAMLTLPTSILTLFPAGVLLGWALIRQKRYRALAAGIAPGLFAGLWYSLNFTKFRAGQAFGVGFGSAAVWGEWLAAVLNRLGVYPWALLAAFAAAYLACRKRAVALLVVGLFPLLAAPLTRGGPPRAYFAVIAVWALLVGAGLSVPELARKRFFGVFFALVLVWGCFDNRLNWRPIDYYALFQAVEQQPPEQLVILPATESNPYAWNNRPEAYKEFIRRLLFRGPERELLMLGSSCGLNGTDGNGAEVHLKLPFAGHPARLDGIAGELYHLSEIRTAPAAGDTIVAIIRPVPEAAMAAIARQLKVYPWIKLNFFLTVNFSPQGVPLHYALLAVKVANPDLLDWVKLLADTRGAVSFYRVKP